MREIAMIEIHKIFACKIELTEEGWRFYFLSSKSDVEVTILKDFSIRIRQEKPLIEDDRS